MLNKGESMKAYAKLFLTFCFFTSVAANSANAADLPLTKGESGRCNTYPVSPMPPLYYGRILLDRMEYDFTGKSKRIVSYELTGWYGGDYQRLWLELEGEHDTGSGNGGEIEKADLLYGRLVTPFWNVRAGVGYAGSYNSEADDRFFGVLGLKGLAPYLFEIDTNAKFSNKGELVFDLEAEYEISITQKLILQPRLDVSYSLSRLEELDIGPGLSNLRLSLRLRYEMAREFAPYIGICWSTLSGRTRDIAKKEGAARDISTLFAGLRFWF